MNNFGIKAIRQHEVMLFCNQRGWRYESIQVSKKNNKHFIANVLDGHGLNRFILINESGKYYLNTGPKKWVPIEYAAHNLEEAEHV